MQRAVGHALLTIILCCVIAAFVTRQHCETDVGTKFGNFTVTAARCQSRQEAAGLPIGRFLTRHHVVYEFSDFLDALLNVLASCSASSDGPRCQDRPSSSCFSYFVGISMLGERRRVSVPTSKGQRWVLLLLCSMGLANLSAAYKDVDQRPCSNVMLFLLQNTCLSRSTSHVHWAVTEARGRCSVSHARRVPMLSGTMGGHPVLLARLDAQH